MAKQKSAYAQKLLDPRWQKLRLEVLTRAEWKCEHCSDASSPLHVHHGYYTFGKEPWEYELASLKAYCDTCHAMADNARNDLKWMVGQMPLGQQCDLATIILRSKYMSPEVAAEMLTQMADLSLEILKGDTEDGYTAQLAIKQA